MPELPAVVVFKDGDYFTYDGECFATFLKLLVLWYLELRSSSFPFLLPSFHLPHRTDLTRCAGPIMKHPGFCHDYMCVVRPVMLWSLVSGRTYIAGLCARTAVLSGRDHSSKKETCAEFVLCLQANSLVNLK